MSWTTSLAASSRAITGHDPEWLYFDSKLVDYAELSRVNQRGIHFITIRRRGAAIVRRLERLGRLAMDQGRDRHAQTLPPTNSLRR